MRFKKILDFGIKNLILFFSFGNCFKNGEITPPSTLYFF